MRESPRENIDEIIQRQGPHHQEWLQKIADKIKIELENGQLFDPETQRDLDEWAVSEPALARRILEETFSELQTLESTRAPGHEISHLLNNLDSALRVFEEYGNLTEAEKLEVVLACLGHDLGRFLEESLDQIDHRDTEFLAPALVGRHMKAIGELPQKLQLRILYDIATGKVAETGYRTADIVHQADREQLLGSTMLARDIAWGARLNTIELRVPLRPESACELTGDDVHDEYKASWYFLFQKEFYMRNVYPAVSPKGPVAQHRNIQENAVILMLATEGKQQEYEQVFAPELGIVDHEQLDRSKKALDPAIFEASLLEKEEFLRTMGPKSYAPGSELTAMRNLLASDKVVIPDGFDEVMAEKLTHCSEQEQKNVWLMVQYSLKRRHEKRVESLELCNQYRNRVGIDATVARWLAEELDSREAIYQNKSD